jgi:hypothetical protein
LRRVGLKLRTPSRASVDFIRFTIRVRSPTRHSRHVAVAPFSTQPPQEAALQQLGVEPVGFRSPMLPRYRDTRGMDHVRLNATRLEPARQPKAVAAGFEGQRNPRDCAAGLDRSSRQRCSTASSRSGLGSSFLCGCRSIPGTTPPTSQPDWLSSTTEMIVLFWSRATDGAGSAAGRPFQHRCRSAHR